MHIICQFLLAMKLARSQIKYSKKNMFLDKLRKNANYMYFDNFVDIYKNWHWITFAVSCSYFFKLIEVVVSAQPLQVRQSVCVIQAIRMIHIAIFGMWRKLETQKKKKNKMKKLNETDMFILSPWHFLVYTNVNYEHY